MMKKIVVYTLLAVMCLGLIGCGKKSDSKPASYDKEEYSIPAQTIAPTATPAPTQAPVPQVEGGFVPDFSTAPAGASNGDTTAAPAPAAAEATAVPAATPVPTALPTSAPAATTAPQGKVYATKSPTSERVVQGGTAQFVAYAQNSTAVKWFIASPNTGTCFTAAEGPNWFPGLKVSGSNSTTLTLSNIPTSMNGWQVQARFEGNGGPVHTNMATIWCVTMEEAIANGWAVQHPGGGYYAPGYTPGYTVPNSSPNWFPYGSGTSTGTWHP